MAGIPTYAVTDTETGGLDYRVAALTQISIIIVDDAFNELETFAHRIIPRPGYTVHPRAAEINGYNEEEWIKTGLEWEHADRAYDSFLHQWFKDRPCIGVAHNASFDAKFLKHHTPKAYARYLQWDPTNPNREADDGWYCTMKALKEWRSRCKYAGANKLSDLASVAGYTVEGKAHDALVDTRTCLAGFRWLQEHLNDKF
jgi:DNA polymerase III epsilon subunit-like protein